MRHRLGAAVTERLIAAPHRVVIEADGVEKQMCEIVAEIPRPDTGHAEAGQRLHFVKTKLQTLVVGQRIDVRIDRSGAIPGQQQRHAFVQVVNDRGVPLQHDPLDGFRGLVRRADAHRG